MSDAPATAAYGTTRARRASLTYGEFERAADALLAQGEKPGLDNVRKVIGGSPQTIRQLLRRYWSELATHKRSPAQALMRLPAEVADLAEELWQRSLALAAQSATRDDNAAQEHLERLKRDNELRSHALGVKERTLREREEARDKMTQELQDHVATLVAIVSRNSETIAALQTAKLDAEARAEEYRQRLALVIARAVAKNQKVRTNKVTAPPRNGKRRKNRPIRATTNTARDRGLKWGKRKLTNPPYGGRSSVRR